MDFLTKYNEKQENKKKDLVFTQKQTYFNGDMYFLPLRTVFWPKMVKKCRKGLSWNFLLRYWCSEFRFCRRRNYVVDVVTILYGRIFMKESKKPRQIPNDFNIKNEIILNRKLNRIRTSDPLYLPSPKFKKMIHIHSKKIKSNPPSVFFLSHIIELLLEKNKFQT